MILHPGTQERLITETTTGLGVTSREGSIQSDSLLATLWVNSVSSGNLSVAVYTMTDNGKEVLLFTFPTLTAPTVNLLLKKSGISMQRFRVVATYSGICDYEVYIRAVEGAGESSARILGSDSLRTTSAAVTTSPALLIPASLTDRNGLVIKNWSNAGNLFVSEDSGKLPADAYPLGPKDALALDVAAGVEIYAVSDLGTLDIRIAESGA